MYESQFGASECISIKNKGNSMPQSSMHSANPISTSNEIISMMVKICNALFYMNENMLKLITILDTKVRISYRGHMKKDTIDQLKNALPL